MNIRRIVLYAVAIALAPQIIGFVHGFSFVHVRELIDPRTAWVARVIVISLAVILIYARFTIVQETRRLAHLVATAGLAWLLSVVLAAGLSHVLARYSGVPELRLLPSAAIGLGIEVMQGSIGGALGFAWVAYRGRGTGRIRGKIS